VSAIPEFIDSGTHGLLTPDTPQALSDAIQTLANDPARTAALAEAALVRLKSEFGMSPGIARLSQRLTQMCGDS